MPLRKCTGCVGKSRYDPETMIRLPSGWFHSINCATEHGRRKAEKARENAMQKQKRDKKEADKEFRRETKRRKEAIQGRKELYPRLQDLVNQWVVNVRDAGEPCCTCKTQNPSIKYDAGHYLARGRMPELRFELTNIHKQCSIQCNVHGSGMRSEYNEFIRGKYGDEHFAWLNGPHRSLKEQFPHVDDIRAEIDRYRRLLRDEGLKPRW